LKTINVSNEDLENKSLINYLKEQKRKGLNALVTGNVKLKENHEIYASLYERTGLKTSRAAERKRHARTPD